MKTKSFKIVLVVIAVLIAFRSTAQVQRLNSDEFESAIKAGNVQLVDVRTPEEYKDKHLKESLNMNINSPEFTTQLASLDKNKPVYVYCLAGSRSTKAAEYMQAQGFKAIYELEGGINKWIANKKPVEKTGKSLGEGFSLKQLNEHLDNANKLVIVDFNAKWCGPCRKMKPHLDKVAKEQASVVSIIGVDADASEELVERYKVEVLPTLILFKDSKLLLRHEGYLDEEGLLALVKKYQ